MDILLANEAEALALFQAPSLAEAEGALAGRVALAAITRSAEGSTVLARGARFEVPAAPVDKVVDTTGAGDQYAAGLLLGLARGLAPDAAARLGHLAAAEVIGHFGPRPQTPLEPLARAAGLL